MKVIIRKIDEKNEKDIQGFRILMDDLSEHAHDEKLMIEKIRELNKRKDAVLLVAEDSERGILCGSAFGLIFDDLCGSLAPVMIIENVVTHHEYRRKKVGQKVMEALESWGKQKGAHYVILCSAMKREAAHAFYEELGYENVKGFKKYL